MNGGQCAERRPMRGALALKAGMVKLVGPQVRVNRIAIRESIAIQSDSARRPTSLRRNWPGATEIAGNPSSGTTTPGVVIMKLIVVTNRPDDSTPPTSE